jgi:hypothetical protein
MPSTIPPRKAIRRLYELIEALDKRVPRLGEAGELRIVHESAALRQRAMERIAELQTLAKDG